MSLQKINGPNNNYDYYKKETSITSQLNEINIYDNILRNKERFEIIFSKGKNITLSNFSCQKILYLSNSKPKEQILFSFYKIISKENFSSLFPQYNQQFFNSLSSKNSNKNQKTDKNIILNEKRNDSNNKNNEPNEMIDKFFEEEEPLLIKEKKKEIKDKKKFYINKNDNQKPLSKIFGIEISKNLFKYLYLSILLCGIIDSFYLIVTINDKKKIFFCLFNMFTLILSLVLCGTGIYGFIYLNSENNDNSFDKLKLLTICSLVGPIIDFVLSRLSKEVYIQTNVGIAIVNNLFSCVFSLLCLVIINNINENGFSLNNDNFDDEEIKITE